MGVSYGQAGGRLDSDGPVGLVAFRADSIAGVTRARSAAWIRLCDDRRTREVTVESARAELLVAKVSDCPI